MFFSYLHLIIYLFTHFEYHTMHRLAELLDTLDGIKAEDLESNDLDRLQLIETVKKLLSRVETKEERFFDITLTQPIVFAALQVLINIGLWKQWEEVGGVPKSVDELCELCTKKCDANLLRMTQPPRPSTWMIADRCRGIQVVCSDCWPRFISSWRVVRTNMN